MALSQKIVVIEGVKINSRLILRFHKIIESISLDTSKS